MPIYEYRCEACGHCLDALEKISDAPLKDCPACKKTKLKRLISAPSFRLKGSGWYETDFKSDKERKRNLVDSGSSESGSGDSGDKSKKDAADKPKEAAKADAKSTTAAESKPAATKTKTKTKGTGSEAA
jgi:putative FmdB family regulatory protein